jgi:hypothetical protein
MAKLDLLLFSSVEGRVPHGAYGSLLARLIERHIEAEGKELS